MLILILCSLLCPVAHPWDTERKMWFLLKTWGSIPLCLIAQLVEHLPGVSGVLSSNPNEDHLIFLSSHVWLHFPWKYIFENEETIRIYANHLAYMSPSFQRSFGTHHAWNYLEDAKAMASVALVLDLVALLKKFPIDPLQNEQMNTDSFKESKDELCWEISYCIIPKVKVYKSKDCKGKQNQKKVQWVSWIVQIVHFLFFMKAVIWILF